MTLPFENDTGPVIDKIVSARLKHDKLKKRLTVAAIALSAFLMTTVLLLVSGIIHVNQTGGNYITGSYHALISGITKEQYGKISTDPRIELAGLTSATGSIKDVNEAFVRLSQPSALMIVAAAAGLGIIIMAGILVIYCIFYISIISSIKKYGQLRTIGMTAKQIKSLVLKEGFRLTLRAVPIGLAAGTLLSYVLVPQGFRISNMVWVCPLAAVLTYITVRLSIQKPARTASGISPIEASRYETGNNLHKHTKKRRLSVYSLAKIQILRYRKKNMLTISSLILTGVLLLGLSSVLSSIDAREMSLSGFTRGQFVIGFTSQELRENPLEKVQTESPFTDEIYHALASVSGVKEIADDWHLPVSVDLQAAESDAEIVGFVQDDMELLQSCISDGIIPDYENLVSQNQLIIGRPDDFEETFRIQPEVGVSVTLKVFDGNHSENMQFEIAAVLDETKRGNNGDKIDMLLLSVDSMKKIADSNLTYQYVIRVGDEFEQQAEKEIEQILAEHPRLDAVTLSSAVAQNENFLQGTEFALAAAVIFIGCFSVMNLLNTILTGIITRRKEFALMRSVGMSEKQLSSMVHYESLIVVSVGLVLSLSIGGGIGYAVCSFLKSSLMSYLNYQFPYGIAVFYGIIVILCSSIMTEAALKYQNKLSV